MGLGTLPYPSGSPGAGGGPRGASNSLPAAPPPTGSRAYSQSYPDAAEQYATTMGYASPASTTVTNGSSIDPIVAQYQSILTAQQNGIQGQYLNSLGMAQAGYDNNAWYKQASAQNDLARLGLQQGRDVGLARERNAADSGFADRGFAIDSRGNALQRDMGYRANTSEAAGKGSITSGGYQQNNRDILGQFGIAQDTTQLTLDKKKSDLTLDNKAIDSLATEYGIRKSDVMNALQYGMTQLGLDWTQTQSQLASQLNSDDANIRQQALNFMAQIMALPQTAPTLADIFPNGVPSVASTASPTTPLPTTTSGAAYDTTGPYTLTPASTGFINQR